MPCERSEFTAQDPVPPRVAYNVVVVAEAPTRHAPEPASQEDPDRALLARTAQGDDGAFGEFVERHQRRLLRLCERMLGDAEEARDAAQEIFLKVYRKAGSFQPKGKVFTWLYRIATNHCLNKLRRRKIVRFIGLETTRAGNSHGNEDDTYTLDPADAGPDPEAALESRRRWQRVRRALAKLPESQRTVVVLIRFEGLSYRQAAEVLGTTEGAVDSRLVRAMRSLQAELEPET